MISIACQQTSFFELWQSTNKSNKSLLCGIFNFISASNSLKGIWNKATREYYTFLLFSLIVLLSNKRKYTLKSILPFNSPWDETVESMNRSSSDLHYIINNLPLLYNHSWRFYLFHGGLDIYYLDNLYIGFESWLFLYSMSLLTDWDLYKL